jgi:deoxyribose-phosphate aldolase
METEKILSLIDHTLLGVTATWDDIKEICDDGMKYGVASVCIPPSYLAKAKEYVGNRLAICTVIGFPNGYNTTETKVFEAKDAIANGADEIGNKLNNKSS